MDAELDTLTTSVTKTLDNLKEKRDFLTDQRTHYIGIRANLYEFRERSERADENNESQQKNGRVFGDVIIAYDKVYLSIGYEYFVEKPCDEVIAFVDFKLRLMEEAIEKFEDKIKEARTTLNNLKTLKSRDENAATAPLRDEYDNDTLPMEIREELDDEGNVISSTVSPATYGKAGEDLESKLLGSEDAKLEKELPSKEIEYGDSFANNVRGKLLQEKNKSFEKNLDNDVLENVEELTVNDVNSYRPVVDTGIPNVDTDNIYTFADLVEQMDEQDQLDDGTITSDDIEYDYEAFQGGRYTYDENHSEDSEYEEDGDHESNFSQASLVPGVAAQSSFLEQINKLRASKSIIKSEVSMTDHATKPIVSSNTKQAPKDAGKSILKKGTGSGLDKKKKKKSVGFAPALDIHEVESFKEETKKQTHRFPIFNMGPYETFADDMVDDTNNPHLNEFDSDLFASLLGVQDADQIHDKYKKQVTNEAHLEEEKADYKNKVKTRRVSRFKKDRSSSHQRERHPTETKDDVSDIREAVMVDSFVENDVEPLYHTVEGNDDVTNSAVTGHVREHYEESKPIKKHSRFARMANTTMTDPIIEKDVGEGEVNNSSNSTTRMNPVMSDFIVEHDTNVADAINEPSRVRKVSKFLKTKEGLDKSSSDRDLSRIAEEIYDATKEKDIAGTAKTSKIISSVNPIISDIFESSDDFNPSVECSGELSIKDVKCAAKNTTEKGLRSSIETSKPFKKKMSSLMRPRVQKPQQRNKNLELLDEMSSDPEDDLETRIVEADDFEQDEIGGGKTLQEKDNVSKKDQDDNSGYYEDFPTEIKDVIGKLGKNEDSVHVANVDYSALGENLDDMAKAYLLGMYDDDLEEHPGTVLEKVEDFKEYNKEVDELQDDIIQFRESNPFIPFSNHDKDDEEDDNDGPMMVDVVENEDLSDIGEDKEYEDLALHPHVLNESINIEYRRLKEQMIAKMKELSFDDEPHKEGIDSSKELEPIDEFGNPIKRSRFKAQRLNLNIE
ncbi:hypothetical protein KAFR_0C03420 [Kazachstania africana CBS 2517]|uniref:DUF3835 domain-containing protein n=1 Tax=Kazachstania africana (strain ATCC 22294 / BCRC 22015 / CBS 2517 / CECT 1963 / NBRC 1671 / NRRL Y-8276) TaxID=1071382 RepID=H2ASI4_KAZAF|nr:hypothetical protein KAFR_0C03420 [Kazachstania africana CBS 2517]CCF57334.1 hypothetical protein KAFR_0C03420 [Kazachstania africana CBS 2517]